jgi:ubiquinone/menaquinone biosynthesis C-methylase UbiE
VLDFGCGAGGFVDGLLRAGLDAYGCDFSQQLGAGNGRLAAIEEPYRLPYPDGWFDVVVSEQVLEHVQDYEQAFREIRRVLEPSGVSLHEFPGRWVSREPHTFVPLATVIQGRWWLWPWARFGLRNQFQQGKTARETVEHNYQFLHEHTTYYGRRDLARHARRVFPGARLLDVEQLAVGGKRSR